MMPLMHDDTTAILRSYTEEAVAKSRRGPKGKKAEVAVIGGETGDEKKVDDHQNIAHLHTNLSSPAPLQELSDDDLIRELARRRADRFRLAGAMPGNQVDPIDPTGQVCTLTGGDGSIPCRELME